MNHVSFEKLVVLFNPASTKAANAEAHLAALQTAYPGRVVVAHTKRQAADNRAVLKKLVTPADILVVASGDGTLSDIVDCLLHPSMPPAMHGVRVLPVGTGRMNDVAHMLNGKRFDDPLYVLRHGRELPIYPLICVCTPLAPKDKPFTSLALYNLGFGMSGAACQLFNDPSFRAKQQKRLLPLRELEIMKAAWDTVRGAQAFEITVEGQNRQVVDVSCISGNIMAGYYRIPAQLSKPEFFCMQVADNRLLQTARRATKLMTDNYDEGELMRSFSFTLNNPVAAHIGGETFTPPTPCKVTISVHKTPVIMLATNPKA